MISKLKSVLGRGSTQTVGGAASVIALAYLSSQLLGLLRNRLLVAHFGVGPDLSAYYAAFRLPELLFTLLVSGGFAVSFIPVFSSHLARDQREMAWRVTSGLLNILVLSTMIGSILIALFAGPLTTLVAPGFNPPQHDLTVELTRIMAITPMFFAMSSVLGSIQQAFNRFIIFALSGVMYNLGIIAGIVLFADRYGVRGAAWGVVIGVIIQAALQWFGLYGLGFRYRPQLGLKLKGVRQTLKLMVPRSLDQGIDQINYSFETLISSLISSGALANLTLANNLKNVPLVLISSSITTAVFPKLAAQAAKGKRVELVASYVRTARLILFLAIPSAVFAVIMRGYIVRLLLGSGQPQIAATLGWFAGTIVFVGLFQLVSRVYFAMQDTRTPLFVSVGSVPVNIAVGYGLSRIYGVEGLAMAASLVAAFETAILLLLLRKRQGSFGEVRILRAAVLMSLAGAVMASVLYAAVRIFPLYARDTGFLTLAPKFGLLCAIAAIAYLVPCFLMRLNETSQAWTRVREAMARTFNP